MGAKPTAWEVCRYLKTRILNHARWMGRRIVGVVDQTFIVHNIRIS